MTIRLIVMLTLIWIISGCSNTRVIKTHFVPVMSKPILPMEPKAPQLLGQLPPTITLTRVETDYYAEVCSAWESGDYTPMEMSTLYPGLSRSSACDWAIKGYTIQGSITVEFMWGQVASYIESLRLYNDILKQQIQNMYESGLDTEEAMRGISSEPIPQEPSSWFNF